MLKLNYSLIVNVISYNYAKTNLMLYAKAYSIHLFKKTCNNSELKKSHKRVFTVMTEKRRVLYDYIQKEKLVNINIRQSFQFTSTNDWFPCQPRTFQIKHSPPKGI